MPDSHSSLGYFYLQHFHQRQSDPCHSPPVPQLSDHTDVTTHTIATRQVSKDGATREVRLDHLTRATNVPLSASTWLLLRNQTLKRRMAWKGTLSRISLGPNLAGLSHSSSLSSRQRFGGSSTWGFFSEVSSVNRGYHKRPRSHLNHSSGV